MLSPAGTRRRLRPSCSPRPTLIHRTECCHTTTSLRLGTNSQHGLRFLACRARTEKELQGLLSEKDAETVRLRAEIGRLRHAAQQADKLNEAHALEVGALQAQLQASLQTSKWVAVVTEGALLSPWNPS